MYKSLYPCGILPLMKLLILEKIEQIEDAYNMMVNWFQSVAHSYDLVIVDEGITSPLILIHYWPV